MVRPNRNASPLPLLDHSRDSLFDESADMGERPAPPVAQFPDPRVDQPRWGFARGRCALLHIVCTSFGSLAILRSYQSPIMHARPAMRPASVPAFRPNPIARSKFTGTGACVASA